jgi:hypothetical protein
MRDFVFMAAVAVSLSACAAEPARFQASSPEGDEIARVERADGASVAFIEIEPGAILVTGRAPSGSPPPLEGLSVRDHAAADIYEALVGEAAPAALVAAASRRDVDDEWLADAPDDAELAPVEPASLTADGFRQRHCQDDSGRVYVCLVNQRGDHTESERLHIAVGAVDALDGALTIRLRRYKRLGGWTNLRSETVDRGDVYTYQISWGGSIKRRFRVEVRDADATKYHFSFGAS